MNYNFSKKLAVTSLILSSVLFVNNAQAASTLSGDLNIDDSYTAYLSTNNTANGMVLSSDDKWYTQTSFFGAELISGQNYFLHIFGKNDNGGAAGFIGDFSIAGSDHSFANGFNTASTAEIGLWTVSDTAWGNDGTVQERLDPSNLTLPSIDTAIWLWDSQDQVVADEAYFTLEINATSADQVPEPSVLLLLATGLLGFAGIKKKKA